MKQNKLKSLRVLHSLTQSEMAAILKMDYVSYNLKENGKREFTRPEIDKILEYLKLSYEDVF